MPARKGVSEAPHLEPFADHVRDILSALGEDTGRGGLVKTPERVESSLRWLTQGYRMTVHDAVGDAVFEETHQSMIMVRDIELYSLCEHHLLPFFGRAHVAYVPNGKILGLSKVARIVDVYARRLQVQERLTDQIADAVMDVLHPTGVGVVIEAAHFCMMMRGVEKQNSRTITSTPRPGSSSSVWPTAAAAASDHVGRPRGAGDWRLPRHRRGRGGGLRVRGGHRRPSRPLTRPGPGRQGCRFPHRPSPGHRQPGRAGHPESARCGADRLSVLGARYHLIISSRATRADGVGGRPISLLSRRVNGQEEVPASA